MRTPADRPLLLINTNSRQGQGSLERAAALLEAGGLPVRARGTGSAEASDRLLRAELEAGARLVIVGGGDGTLSRAAGVLRGSSTALGVLPLGSGNTFARSVGVPVALEGAVQVLTGGRDRAVDLGLLRTEDGSETVFLNSVGLGFSAELADQLTGELKRHLGLLAWPAASLQVFGRHHPLRLRLSIGGRSTTLRTHQLLIANGRYVAGPVRAAPGASVTDGRLDVLALGNGRLLSLLWAALGWLTTRRVGGGALHFTTHELQVESLDVGGGALLVSVDGEVSRAARLSLGVAPEALLVRVPQDFEPRQV